MDAGGGRGSPASIPSVPAGSTPRPSLARNRTSAVSIVVPTEDDSVVAPAAMASPLPRARSSHGTASSHNRRMLLLLSARALGDAAGLATTAETIPKRKFADKAYKMCAARLGRPGDPRVAVVQKGLSVLGAAAVLAWSAVLVGSWGKVEEDWYGLSSAFVAGCASMGLLAYVCSLRRLPEALFTAYLVALAAAAVLYDVWAAANVAATVWPVFLILIEACEASSAPSVAHTAMGAAAVLWLLIARLPSLFNGNLLHRLHAASAQSSDWAPMACSCAHPPCHPPAGIAALELLVSLFLVLAVLAGGAVRRWGRQRSAARAAFGNALLSSVLRALVSYDLAMAEMVLRTVAAGDIDPEVHDALCALVVHMKSYKAFLPQSSFWSVDTDNANVPVPAESPSPQSTGAPAVLLNTLLERVDSEESGFAECFSPTSSTGTSTPAVKWSATTQCISTPPPAFTSQRARARGAFDPATSPLAVSFAVHLRLKRVSLMNVTAWLPVSLQNTEPGTYVARHEEFLSVLQGEVSAKRGVVDTFVANCVMASFNASIPNERYAMRAVAALESFVDQIGQNHNLQGLKTTACVVSGQVRVGVLGTETLRRPTILGTLPHLASQLERFQLMRPNYEYVCDWQTFSDVSLAQQASIVMDTIVVEDVDVLQRSGSDKDITVPGAAAAPLRLSPRGMDKAQMSATLGSLSLRSAPTPQLIYELLFDGRSSGTPSVSPRSRPRKSPRSRHVSSYAAHPGGESPAAAEPEWMYQLETAPGRVWELYNEAGKKYHTVGIEAAMDHLAQRRATAAQLAKFRDAVAQACTVILIPSVQDGTAQPLPREGHAKDVTETVVSTHSLPSPMA
eukprot:TRINITY_DN2699_c2_g1_i1.p1 TRINITY_DN2699_c2_g1~~TRINITY_DN2699_c2_g1_i1.p1  ORF type:complete len:849 (+),score=207.58 TRINITY_DN2699_c2_g1_i1:44-2590(+)